MAWGSFNYYVQMVEGLNFMVEGLENVFEGLENMLEGLIFLPFEHRISI